MQALVKRETAPGLWLEDVPEPTVAARDVLIKVDRTGICGTDLHIYKWDDWARETVPVPLVVGHEFVGEIVEIGSDVKDFSVGEIVSGEGHVVCGHCRNCMAGRRHLCNDTAGIGVTRPGAFAELISLPQTNVWVHEPDINREVASIFDPFGNAVQRLDIADMRLAVARIRATRAAVGQDIEILVEGHGRLSPNMAIRMARYLPGRGRRDPDPNGAPAVATATD